MVVKLKERVKLKTWRPLVLSNMGDNVVVPASRPVYSSMLWYDDSMTLNHLSHHTFIIMTQPNPQRSYSMGVMC